MVDTYNPAHKRKPVATDVGRGENWVVGAAYSRAVVFDLLPPTATERRTSLRGETYTTCRPR